jgi:putative membrane protein
MDQRSNVTEHLANERTFLAWVRTSIGIMAFGFVLVKFSLFMRQLTALLEKKPLHAGYGFSAVAGIIIVAAGTLAVVLGWLRYLHAYKHIQQGRYSHSTVVLSVLTGFILLMGLLLSVYLATTI